MRVEGAVHFTKMGLDLFVITLMARWRSPMILRYAEEAPLDALTDKYKESIRTADLSNTFDQLAKDVEELKRVSAKIPTDANNHLHQELQHRSMTAHTPSSSSSSSSTTNTAAGYFTVRNPLRKKWHRAAIYDNSGKPSEWCTSCGWYFGNKQFEGVSELIPEEVDSKNICGTCFPAEKVIKEMAEGDFEGGSEDSAFN